MKLKSLSNVVRIAINDDPARVIEFNPDDVGFVERFYALIDNVEAKENEIKEKLEEIRKDQTESPYGMPNSIRREVQLTAEMCRYMREQIDTVNHCIWSWIKPNNIRRCERTHNVWRVFCSNRAVYIFRSVWSS